MNSKPKKVIHVTVPFELYEQLKELAQKTGRSVPKFVSYISARYVRYLSGDPEGQAQISLHKTPWPVADD